MHVVVMIILDIHHSLAASPTRIYLQKDSIDTEEPSKREMLRWNGTGAQNRRVLIWASPVPDAVRNKSAAI